MWNFRATRRSLKNSIVDRKESSKQESSDRIYDLFIAVKVFVSRITRVHGMQSSSNKSADTWKESMRDFLLTRLRMHVLWRISKFFYKIMLIYNTIRYLFFYSISITTHSMYREKMLRSQTEPWYWILFCYFSIFNDFVICRFLKLSWNTINSEISSR